MIDRPKSYTREMKWYLDELRESGEINMFGAAPVLQQEFNLSRAEAKACLVYWMETFDSAEDEEHDEMEELTKAALNRGRP